MSGRAFGRTAPLISQPCASIRVNLLQVALGDGDCAVGSIVGRADGSCPGDPALKIAPKPNAVFWRFAHRMLGGGVAILAKVPSKCFRFSSLRACRDKNPSRYFLFYQRVSSSRLAAPAFGHGLAVTGVGCRSRLSAMNYETRRLARGSTMAVQTTERESDGGAWAVSLAANKLAFQGRKVSRLGLTVGVTKSRLLRARNPIAGALRTRLRDGQTEWGKLTLSRCAAVEDRRSSGRSDRSLSECSTRKAD